MKDLVSLGNLLSIEFMKPSRQFYAAPSKQTWGPQDLKNKMLKTTYKSLDDRPCLETTRYL